LNTKVSNENLITK